MVQNGKMTAKIKKPSINLIINIAVILSLIFILYYGTRPPDITVYEDYVRISGMYGMEFMVEDISNLELREALPTIQSRINGMNLFGLANRGIYELEELGRTRLYSFSKGGPFIVMQVTNEYIVINFRNAAETESLYKELEEATNKN